MNWREIRLAALAVLVLFAAVAAGCSGPAGVASTPAEVAASTKVDEQAAIGAEVLYTTASTFGNTLSRAGLINRERFQQLDAKAYKALLLVRSAYRAGNADSFAVALAELNNLAKQIRDLKEQ